MESLSMHLAKPPKIGISITVLLLSLLCLSCEFTPHGGIERIACSSSSIEARQRGSYIVGYKPEDTLIEYHDSLVDIKFVIKEAFLEHPCYEKHTIPPSKTPQIGIMDWTYVFIVCFEIDSSSTDNLFKYNYTSNDDTNMISGSDWSNVWWTLGYKCISKKSIRVGYTTIDLCENHEQSPLIDTIRLALCVDCAYTKKVWGRNLKRKEVLLREIQFVLEDTAFQSPTLSYSDACNSWLDMIKNPEIRWVHNHKRQHFTIAEMDSMYSRVN